LAKIVRNMLNEMNRKNCSQVSDRMYNKPMESAQHGVSEKVQVPLLAVAD